MRKKIGYLFLFFMCITISYTIVGYNTEMQAAGGFNLAKGTKVVLGDGEVIWDVGPQISGDYLLMSSVPFASMTTETSSSSCTRGNGSPGFLSLMLTSCPFSNIDNAINTITLSANETSIVTQAPHLPKIEEAITIPLNDRIFNYSTYYWLSGYLTHKNMKFNALNVYAGHSLGSEIYTIYGTSTSIPLSQGISYGTSSDGHTNPCYADVRPYASISNKNIVFAAPTDFQDGIWHPYSIDTSQYHNDNENNPVMLRVTSSLTASLNNILNSKGDQITETVENSTVTLDVNATGNGTISILIYDASGTNVSFFKSTSQTNGRILLDLTGIPCGNYQVAVINENFTGSYRPIESSEISNKMSLEIKKPHKLQYAKQPQAGASIGKDYEYSKNVNGNQTIGKITVNPQGVMPLTYTLETNGGDNSYLNFEIDGLNPANESSATNLNVKIKASAPDLSGGGLNAGVYKFCISTQDDNGHPAMPSTSDQTKVCTSLTVEKANPTIVFNVPNQTKKSISNASTSWSELATSTPSAGTKISYTKVGGDIAMINIDPDTGAITYNGGNAFGKVKIRATVDDDPSTGNDNYNPSFVEKEIVIYREVDGVITPDPASSDTTIPTFSASDTNIKTGGTIGKVQGTLGTPDTIGGSTTTYSYTIKSDPTSDGSLFQVNASTGVIKANANLGVDTYNFVIIVSDKWSSKEIPVTVNVGKAPAENLKFYQSPTSNTIITTKSAALTDTGVSVYATVKGSSNTNPVTYRIKDGSTNVITVHPNSGAITINGVGSVIIVAEKTGNTGQANAIAELTFTVTAGSQQFIYTDASGNELPKSGNDYDDYSEVYGQGKTFQLYTAGNPAGTNVTYALKAGSPTDVISVDPSGLVSILNASLKTQIGQVIVEATSHDPTGNYTDKTIELPINITKANQTISFSGVTSAQNGKGKVTPLINAQDISSNDGGVTVSDTNYYISVDPSASGIAWTSNGVDIDYNYTGNTTIEIPLEVTKAGNRNYNSATAKGKMKILSPSESTLSVSQPGKIYYGDHFTIRSLQDDSSSSNVNYTFTVDNTIFVSNPTVNGNSADFDALKCSSGTKINITVTRTADSEVTLSKVVTIEVLPKDINVIIDDKTKQKGEPNPPLTFQDFTSQLVSWNGVQDVVDLNDVKLSTSATTNSKSGSYPITGNPKTMNTTYPNYNFIFKEGKLMIDSQVDKDVDGDGKPDFNDPDGDDCPDLNIKWQDDSGNWVVINGDRDYDGIPDLNIDSDGDGVPDLNIDTDNDGKPDINLVILKKTDWKPTKCVTVSSTVKEEYCTGTKVKPQINVDTDNDNIPNINIDTDGDMKADINISLDGKTASVNIAIIHPWKPDKDYTHQKFLYDTIGKAEPYLNIDTNGDGCPDINIDTDGDDIADLNIDTDDDQIPNVEIDTTGDGQANANIDTNGDGEPDENIIEITEWKPDKKVGNICTMIIKQKTELEDNGIKVEKPDGTPFLPNYALKVEEVTDSKKEEIANDAKDFIKETNEIKKVYDVKLLKDGVEVQPDGTIKVKIPYEGIKSPILIRRLEDGTYEQIDYKVENGYLVYETENLGIVSIIGEKEYETSVKGSYTPNIGGAITGDETDITVYIGFICIALGLFSYLLFKQNHI